MTLPISASQPIVMGESLSSSRGNSVLQVDRFKRKYEHRRASVIVVKMPLKDRDISVLVNNDKAGSLFYNDKGNLSFQYDADWIEQKRHPISLSLPLTEKQYKLKDLQNYFSGLTPDQTHLDEISKQTGCKNYFFDFLYCFGRETAGAIKMQPARSLSPLAESNVFHLTPDDVSVVPDALVESSFLLTKGLSQFLSGQQKKISVLCDNDKLFLCADDKLSTHIVKFGNSEYRNILENEYFCLELARLIGLNVVDASLIKREEENIGLLVRRYDRRISDSDESVTAIHQEDFCQALNISPENKYQGNDTRCKSHPSYKRFFQLLASYSKQPETDIDQLLSLVIFNLIIGNNDAHARNISILFNEDGTVILAPFYDLVSTKVYSDLEDVLPIKIGGVSSFDLLDERAFTVFSKDICQSYESVMHKFDNISKVIFERIAEKENEGKQGIEYEITALIKERIICLREQLNLMD